MEVRVRHLRLFLGEEAFSSRDVGIWSIDPSRFLGLRVKYYSFC